jgi:hypothetical protein
MGCSQHMSVMPLTLSQYITNLTHSRNRINPRRLPKPPPRMPHHSWHVFYSRGKVVEGVSWRPFRHCVSSHLIVASLLYQADEESRYILCTGSGILGVSIGINALSHHAACTVWWSVMATVAIAIGGSIRKFHTIGWLT